MTKRLNYKELFLYLLVCLVWVLLDKIAFLSSNPSATFLSWIFLMMMLIKIKGVDE